MDPIGLQDTIEQELNAQPQGDAVAPGEDSAAAPAADPNATPAQEANQDPEIDIGGTKVKKSVLDALDIDLDDKRKVKLADLRKGYMQNDDYTKKTQELAAERAKNKELLDWSNLVVKNPKFANILATLTDKGITNTGFNEAILDKVLAALEDKQEAAAQRTDQLEDALKNMDPLDPNYEAFKQALEKNKALEQRINGLEQKIQGTEAQTQQQKQQQAIQQAQTKITSALDAMTDPAKPDSLKFTSPEEKALWRKEVLFFLAHNPRKINSEEDFDNLLKEVGTQVHSQINKMFEARLAAHLQKKPQLPAQQPGPNGKPPAAPADPNKPLMEQGSLQDRIAAGLEEAMREEQNQ